MQNNFNFWKQQELGNKVVPLPKLVNRKSIAPNPTKINNLPKNVTQVTNVKTLQPSLIENKATQAGNAEQTNNPYKPINNTVSQIEFTSFVSLLEAYLRENRPFNADIQTKFKQLKSMDVKSGLQLLSKTLEDQIKTPKPIVVKSAAIKTSKINVILGESVEAKEIFPVDVDYDSPIPLCLPDNMEYKNKKCSIIPGKARTKLVANPEALEILRNISGRVCVLSIVGPCRTGKSYILNQILRYGTKGGKIFSLGHTMDPETMGIWMWGRPFPIQLESGETVTLILLDSEGLSAIQAEAQHDNQIYALTALLSSYMIYNSVGRPVADDLDKLNFVVNLVKSIKVKNEQQSPSELSNEFPNFLWLFRDCVLEPCIGKQPCSITEYLTGVIFKIQHDFNAFGDDISNKRNQIRKCIMECFPSIKGHMLPPPTDDANILKNIENEAYAKSLSKQFLSGVAILRKKILADLLPKKVRNQFVVGEMFATLVSHYVDVLNNPAACPVIQSAWDLAVSTAITAATKKAQELFAQELKEKFTNKFPMESDAFNAIHDSAQKNAEKSFLDNISLHSEAQIMQHIPLLLVNFSIFYWKFSVTV
jgi:hypothetical protein